MQLDQQDSKDLLDSLEAVEIKDKLGLLESKVCAVHFVTDSSPDSQ